MSYLADRKTFKKKIADEKMALALAFQDFENFLNRKKLTEIKNLSEDVIDGSMLKKDDLIKKLLDYIKNQIVSVKARDNLKNLLSIFTLMIKNSNEVSKIQDLFN